MEPADGLFSEELREATYNLLCIHNDWKYTSSIEGKVAALLLVHWEVSLKPCLRKLLPGLPEDFIHTPDSLPVSL